MAGPLGPYGWYLYTSDNGISWNQWRRVADATAVSATATGEGDHPPIPARLHPRHVWGAAAPGVRRKFAIADRTSTFLTTGGSISVDGLVFIVTGRVGESQRGGVAS